MGAADKTVTSAILIHACGNIVLKNSEIHFVRHVSVCGHRSQTPITEHQRFVGLALVELSLLYHVTLLC